MMARRDLGPASLAVVQAVDGSLEETDGALLVACSGGPDSLALAAAVWRVAGRRGLPAAAIVVDHGLQPDSSQVAARAAGQLRAIGFAEIVLERIDVDLTSGLGPEAAARAARYRAFDAHAARLDATTLLGHTLDDQAETVLLGLARGSGARSLAGMAVRSAGYLRPLLRLRRTETEAMCIELGLEPWQDPHNADPRYARVRVRRTVLPVLEAELGPGIAEALARTAALLGDDADLLDQLAAAADPGTETLECGQLAQLHPALRRRVIRRWLQAGGAADVTRRHVLAIESLVLDWHGQRSVQLSAAEVVRQDGVLQLTARSVPTNS
jgi:tRNA(Ile)-lysidine synthase